MTAAANTSCVRPVTTRSEQAADLTIQAGAAALHLPTIRAEASRIAQAAVKERLTYKAFLAEVLTAELDDRDSRRRSRRISEAKFPRLKRLEDLDLRQLSALPATVLAALSAGTWIDRGEPVVLLGDSGTGKTHLLIGLGVAAAEAGRRVRYITTAALVNELVEAADDKQLSRVVGRYGRLDLLCLDLCRGRDYAEVSAAVSTGSVVRPSRLAPFQDLYLGIATSCEQPRSWGTGLPRGRRVRWLGRDVSRGFWVRRCRTTGLGCAIGVTPPAPFGGCSRIWVRWALCLLT